MFSPKAHSKSVTDLTSLGGGSFASSSQDQLVKVWTGNGELKHVLERKEEGSLRAVGEERRTVGENNRGHTWGILSVASLGDGRLVTGGEDHMVRVWDAETGECDPALVCLTDSSFDSEAGSDYDQDDDNGKDEGGAMAAESAVVQV